jgi:transposase
MKTDRLDSEMLARLLRADLIPEAYASSKEVRAKKRVLRQRMFLVRVRTMVKNRVRALLCQHGVEPPPVSDLFGKKGLAWLKEEPELPDPDGWLLREEVEPAETLKEKIRATARGSSRSLRRGIRRWGGSGACPRRGRVLLGVDPPRGRGDGALPQP